MEAFDFNSYIYQEIDVTIDPALYTFLNAPTTMNGAFKFTNLRTYSSDISQQIVTMDSGNIIYTREYHTDTATFTDWITTNGSGGGSITSMTSINETISITNPLGPVVDLSANLAIKSTSAPYSTVATDRIVQITNSGTVVLNSEAALAGNIITIVALGGNVDISGPGIAPLTIPGSWSMSFYYNALDLAWRIASAALPTIQNITSIDNSLFIDQSLSVCDIKINNAEVVVDSSGSIIADTNKIYVNTTGTTQTLPLGSTVTPYKSYTFFNGNIATTAVVPTSPDLLNGGSSAINIDGPYNSVTFEFSPTQGWRAS